MTQRYDTYKDSGVQWIGEIPGHWGCVRLKYITSKIGSGSTPTGGADVYQDHGVIFLRSQNIYNYGLELVDVAYISEDIHQEMKGTHVHSGDILYNITGGSIGRCCLAPESLGEANVNQHVSIVRPRNVENKFLLYSLQSEYCQTQMRFLQTGGNREGLSATAFKLFNVALPPLSEQRSIVSYLDAKCGKIDEWVTKKQKEVEHLQELKQRVIADAVTRGLNPHVKMKATNIPWLKEIPEHWEMSKISSHFRQRNEKVSDKDYPALSVSKQGVTPQLDNVALSNAEGTSRKLVKVGDYAVNSRSDRKGSCGVSKYEGSVSLITIVLEPFNINGEYIHYLFRSNLWVEEFYRNGRGIVADLWTTNYQMMKSMYMPVPPLSEQKQIVSYLDAKTSQIDKLIAHITKEIECIKEYKQRRISEVVTGQIKVC